MCAFRNNRFSNQAKKQYFNQNKSFLPSIPLSKNKLKNAMNFSTLNKKKIMYAFRLNISNTTNYVSLCIFLILYYFR